MKSIKSIFVLLLVFTLSDLAIAQSGKKEGSFNASNTDELFINISLGMEVSITGSDTDQISYVYEFEGNDTAYERFFEHFDPSFETKGGAAQFSLQYPEQGTGRTYRIDQNELTIKVPAHVKLDVRSQYSSFKITDIERDVTIQTRSGSVDVSEIGQSLHVNNEYGNITAKTVQGDVTLVGRSSTINLADISGMVNVRSNYSNITIARVDGNLNIENRSGNIDIRNIQGDVTASGDYTEMKVSGIIGRTNLQSKSGDIEVENVRALSVNGSYTDVTARNIESPEPIRIISRSAKITLDQLNSQTVVDGNYLEISAKNIHGNLTVSNRSGKFNGENINGSFDFNGEYTDVNLAEFNGEVISINTRSGDVEIDAKNPLSSCMIHAEYGDVDLDLAEQFTGRISMAAAYGEIKHNLRISNPAIRSHSSEKIIEGIIGSNSQHQISIRSRNGSITVNQQ